MFRIDFGRCMLENVKELLMSVLLCAWDRTYVHNLDSCVRSFVLTYAGLFLRLCICGNGPMYAGHTWALTRIRETLGKKPYVAHFHLFFTCCASICNPNTPFCHFCT